MSNDTHTSRGRGARAALVVGVAFVAGAVAGAAGDRAWVAARVQGPAAAASLFVGERQIREPEPREGRRPPENDTAIARLRALRIPDQFAGLGLTPAQLDRLAAIAQRRRPQSDSVSAVVRALAPTVRRMETEMMQEMVCALTPSQQADWLAHVQSGGMDPEVVAERYRLVRTHTCPAPSP